MVRKQIDKNKGFTAGEEGIVLQACIILENRKLNYIYTSIRDRKEYILSLKDDSDNNT